MTTGENSPSSEAGGDEEEEDSDEVSGIVVGFDVDAIGGIDDVVVDLDDDAMPKGDGDDEEAAAVIDGKAIPAQRSKVQRR